MRVLQVENADRRASLRRRSIALRGAIYALVCASLCAATFQVATIASAQWRDSDQQARAVLRDPRSTAADQRRALFVLSRHDRENAELVKALAARTDYVGEHARNLVHQARENWR